MRFPDLFLPAAAGKCVRRGKDPAGLGGPGAAAAGALLVLDLPPFFLPDLPFFWWIFFLFCWICPLFPGFTLFFSGFTPFFTDLLLYLFCTCSHFAGSVPFLLNLPFLLLALPPFSCFLPLFPGFTPF